VGLEAAQARLMDCLSQEISDKRVLSAMARVPRERFVSPDYYYAAYEDMPLSIGFGQTISQPFIVALMTQALRLKGDEKVLELGTGSGYQTAILARLAKGVVSIERVPQLAESAGQILEKLGYTNIEIHTAVEALVGSRWEQDLLRVTRRKKGNVVESLGGCRFVPLIGKGAWEEG